MNNLTFLPKAVFLLLWKEKLKQTPKYQQQKKNGVQNTRETLSPP